MLPVTVDAVRLFLHVTAATVWVGGQLVLAGLVPVLRPAGRETVAAAARRFQLLAWPAYAVLVATGLWNLQAEHFSHQAGQWKATVMVKIAAVAVAGVCSASHTRFGAAVRQAPTPAHARRSAALAGVTAGLALLLSLFAVFCGVQLRA